MNHRPLIGVSTSEVRRADQTQPSPESDPKRRELALGMTYLEAVERAGGIPVILAPLCDIGTDALLDRLDGLLLSGGPDISPASYGAEAHEKLGPTEPDLDAFELRLARRARARGIPVLGVCRGMQLLNVARGGTLVQHVPDLVGEGIAHRQAEPGDVTTHHVHVQAHTRLAHLTGHQPTLPVNSLHHQAIDRLGDGLRPVAWSPDGLIEAVEAPLGPFVMGVQWHAECLARPEQRALFAALVEAARAAAPVPVLRAA